MYAVAPQMADGTESAPPVTGTYALGGVFNHVQMVPLCAPGGQGMTGFRTTRRILAKMAYRTAQFYPMATSGLVRSQNGTRRC